MKEPAQQVSGRGIRIMGVFVIAYLGIGFHLWLNMDLPGYVYVIYGVLAWIVGMMLFYHLHRSYMAELGEDVRLD